MKINSLEEYNQLKSWPFEEAKRIIELYGGFKNFKKPNKNFIIFETGYGPSGLPHIGTFGEVVRTTMVKNAFEKITNCKSKIITFSDDMDGLRKIPDNIPNRSYLEKFIGTPLTSIPDPFNKYESFGQHNNEKLKSFLDTFGFSYEFLSSTKLYKSGFFDETIKIILQNYKKILSIMLPTLRAERQKNYSPFLPICPNTNKVLQVKIEEYKLDTNSIVYKDENTNKFVEVSVLKGGCKLQWKVDWAMRWVALEVDYEMCGKDLSESVNLGKSICSILDKKSPVNFIYEMFLDENGEKISKSRGNGISIEEWLNYSSQESLSLFMFHKPKSAKKLYFSVIPKSLDEYAHYLNRYYKDTTLSKFDNPIWHIHSGNIPKIENTINFNTLVNLVSVCNSTDHNVIWAYIKEYNHNFDPKEDKYISVLIGYAIKYYKDFILETKKYRLIDQDNEAVFLDLKKTLLNLQQNLNPEEIQKHIYEVGKKHKFENLKDFFKLLYQVLLGQEQGPRLGSFIALYGINKSLELIDRAINREDLSK